MTHHISPALQRADPSFASIPDPLTNFCSSSRPLEIWTSFAQGKHENNGFVLSFHFNSFLIYTKNNKNPPRDIIQSLIIHNPILSLPVYATKRRRCVTSCRRLRLVWSLSTHKLRLYQSNNDINPSFLLAFGSIFNWITYVGETTTYIFLFHIIQHHITLLSSSVTSQLLAPKPAFTRVNSTGILAHAQSQQTIHYQKTKISYLSIYTTKRLYKNFKQDIKSKTNSHQSNPSNQYL